MFPIFRAQQRPPGSRPAAALATSSGLRCSTAPAADTSASSQLQQNGNAFIKSSLPANTDASSQASLALKSTSTETCINLDAEQQVSEASDDDEDIIFVKSGKRQVQTLPSKSVSRKAIFGGAAPKKVPVITIPDSPPSKQDSTDGFKPLSELHSAQRAKRKAEQPRLPRWPTFEEHMLSSSASPTIREAVHSRWRTAHASVVPADVNLEVFSGLSRDPGDLLARQEVGSSPSLVELRGSTPSAQPLPTTSSIAIDAQPVLPAIDSTLWTSRYAPKSAADVLGAVSGRSARHLKEWLQELALTDGSESQSPSEAYLVFLQLTWTHIQCLNRGNGDGLCFEDERFARKGSLATRWRIFWRATKMKMTTPTARTTTAMMVAWAMRFSVTALPVDRPNLAPLLSFPD